MEHSPFLDESLCGFSLVSWCFLPVQLLLCESPFRPGLRKRGTGPGLRGWLSTPVRMISHTVVVVDASADVLGLEVADPPFDRVGER